MSDDDEMIYSAKTQEQGDDEIEEDADSVYGFGDSEPEAESTSSSSASELAVPINVVEIPQQDDEEEQNQKEDICFTTEFFDPKTDDLSKFRYEPKGVKCLSWHAGTWYCLVDFDSLSSLMPYEYLEKHMPDILVKFILENLEVGPVDGNLIGENPIASLSENSTHDSDIEVDIIG